MTSADLWNFVRTHGLKPSEIAIPVFGVLMLALEVWLVLSTLQKSRREWTYNDVIMPFVSFIIVAACFLLPWALVRKRYLLRPGAGRYTIATVYKQKWWRGRHKFVSAYYVAGQRCQIEEDCGIADARALPCPDLGTRRYIYFAPEDPTTSNLLAGPVPDSVRTIPPLGWAKLP